MDVFWWKAVILCLLTVSAYRLVQKRHTKDDVCNKTEETLTRTGTCPFNETELNVRKKTKKCNEHPKCKGKQLEYHCIEFNGYLAEVCVPREIITGNACAIYDAGLGRAIHNFKRICSDCPVKYNSTDSAMVKSCIKPLEKPIPTSGPEKSTHTSQPKEDKEQRPGNGVGKTVLTVFSCLAMTAIGITAVYYNDM